MLSQIFASGKAYRPIRICKMHKSPKDFKARKMYMNWDMLLN